MELLRRPLDDLKQAKVPTSAKVGKIATGKVELVPLLGSQTRL